MWQYFTTAKHYAIATRDLPSSFVIAADQKSETTTRPNYVTMSRWTHSAIDLVHRGLVVLARMVR